MRLILARKKKDNSKFVKIIVCTIISFLTIFIVNYPVTYETNEDSYYDTNISSLTFPIEAVSSKKIEQVYYEKSNNFSITTIKLTNSDSPIQINEPTLEEYVIPVSDEEIERMVRSCHAESYQGTFEDIEAVAATMVNRYKETKPENKKKGMFSIISGIQFTNPSTANQIAVHNFNTADLAEDSIYYQAVISSLKGNDPTRGASYFYKPEQIIDPNCWHEKSLDYTGYTSPNGHRFFKPQYEQTANIAV